MARKNDRIKRRLDTWTLSALSEKCRNKRMQGVLFAVLLYVLTSALILFGAVALAKGDELTFRRAHVELTPNAAMFVGVNDQHVVSGVVLPKTSSDPADQNSDSEKEDAKTAEPEKAAVEEPQAEIVVEAAKPTAEAAPEMLESAEPAQQSAVSLTQLDALEVPNDACFEPKPVKQEEDPCRLLKNRIVEIAAWIGKLAPEENSTKLYFVDSQSEDGGVGVTEETLAVLDEQNLAQEFDEDDLDEDQVEEQQIVQYEEEAPTEEEEEAAFAYSNPNLPKPSIPASDFSALGLREALGSPVQELNSTPQMLTVPYPTAEPAIVNAQTFAQTPTLMPAPTMAANGPAAQFQTAPYVVSRPINIPQNAPASVPGNMPAIQANQIPAIALGTPGFQTNGFQTNNTNVAAPQTALAQTTGLPKPTAAQMNRAPMNASPIALNAPSGRATPRSEFNPTIAPAASSVPSRSTGAVKVAAVPNDSFHAKSANTLNGMPSGKTFRTFDESAFGPNAGQTPAQVPKKAPASYSVPRKRSRFVYNDSNVGHIRQVSAVVRANVYNDEAEYDDEYNDDEYDENEYAYGDADVPDDPDLPLVAWQVEERLQNRNRRDRDLRETDDRPVNDVERSYEDDDDYVVDDRTYEAAADADANAYEDGESESWTPVEKPARSKKAEPQTQRDSFNPLRKSTNDSAGSSEENKYFLRPFKRIRERRLMQKAPTPPDVDRLDIENDQTAVELAKEPLLTRESASLPPLSVDTNERYAEESQTEGDEPATRSELEAAREEMKSFSWTKGPLKITPYGFLTLSVANDTQRSVTGDFMLYAQSEDVDNSSGFSVDARTSRIGLKIEGPRIEELHADLGGCAEFDFQGYPNGSKNKGGVQLRRAFAELVDKQNDRRFLAGQDWEIISPGAPQMLNYLPAGFAGDMQYRRGQLRFEQGYTVSSNAHFITQIAACDNVLGDYTSTSGVYAASSGWPIIEGRLGADLFREALNGRAVVLGVSGHIGEQYYRFSPIAGVPMCSTTVGRSIRTWSTNFDFELPILEKHKFHGEYYIGSNLSTFCGGINQGIDLYTRDAIGDKGGWLAFHSDWTKKVATNVGYSFDKPERGDLVGTSVASNGTATSRTKNEVFFVNCLYNWTANFMTGLEVGYWRTDWQKADVTGATPVFSKMKSGKDLRTEFTTRLTF